MSTLDLKLNVDPVALFGAIAGSVSLLINFFSFLRDSIKISVGVKRGWVILRSPVHDPDKTWTIVTVSNQGRRPVTIKSVGFVYIHKKGGGVLADSINNKEREILEGKSTDYLIDEATLGADEYKQIAYFAAYDSAGRTFKKYTTTRFKVFWFWLLDSLKIMKKPKVTAEK